MGPVRIRHSSHDFGWQSSHSGDLAGWQAKMASIEIWIPWRNAHKPHSNRVDLPLDPKLQSFQLSHEALDVFSWLKRLFVFGFFIIGSSEALPIVREVLSVRERERERYRERRKWRHHCRAKIGDEFTLSLAKNSHNWRWAYTFPCQKFALFVSPFTLPVSSFTERSPLWSWNSQWVHTFHCQKFFRRQALFPLFQMARAARRVIENPRQMIKSCPVLFCSSHRKNESN